jgi:hypothetical protein
MRLSKKVLLFLWQIIVFVIWIKWDLKLVGGTWEQLDWELDFWESLQQIFDEWSLQEYCLFYELLVVFTYFFVQFQVSYLKLSLSYFYSTFTWTLFIISINNRRFLFILAISNRYLLNLFVYYQIRVLLLSWVVVPLPLVYTTIVKFNPFIVLFDQWVVVTWLWST